ncbi:MAG: hypothetical protein COU25_02845 [Candidatus Levybacteria bacterium CG10_big_fil_rev_8_21_14_0_10_35_13]|nr:MAG: hypothetical protein COU25_02845 [Candidatus Levybacteria bacterium CG10_big_fil_rev_8_21_14_0_10_35_13]
MIEQGAANLDISLFSPDKKVSPKQRLDAQVKTVSDELGLDPFLQESLRRFGNIYLRLRKVKIDFGKRKPLFHGYPIEPREGEDGGKTEYFWLSEQRSDDFIDFLSRGAFDTYDSFLSGDENTKIAVYRVREFIHLLFR